MPYLGLVLHLLFAVGLVPWVLFAAGGVHFMRVHQLRHLLYPVGKQFLAGLLGITQAESISSGTETRLADPSRGSTTYDPS